MKNCDINDLTDIPKHPPPHTPNMMPAVILEVQEKP